MENILKNIEEYVSLLKEKKIIQDKNITSNDKEKELLNEDLKELDANIDMYHDLLENMINDISNDEKEELIDKVIEKSSNLNEQELDLKVTINEIKKIKQEMTKINNLNLTYSCSEVSMHCYMKLINAITEKNIYNKYVLPLLYKVKSKTRKNTVN